MTFRQRIAVVGTGIAGLSAAWLLHRHADVTVYESEPRPGGHSNTALVPWRGARIPVDVGFIVYNEANYPLLTRLFEHLGVRTHDSDMSFSVSVDRGALEYAGQGLQTLFAQKRNALRPGFLRMLYDIVRFNREAEGFLESGRDDLTLGDYLDQGRYGPGFRRHYLLPMAAAIWSASLASIQAYPACAFLAFFRNHGLLGWDTHHRWRTVSGGSRRYVAELLRPLHRSLRLATPVVAIRRGPFEAEVVDAHGGIERFDQVVLACHADQALAMIDRPTRLEESVLSSFRFQPNRAVLHQDARLMPRRRKVWSSWNYLAQDPDDHDAVAVTYWMNRLQGLEPACPLFLSLNPVHEPAEELVHARFDYRHPVFDHAALGAQDRLPELQGSGRLWFAGAWTGCGFHEDGLRSGLEVARRLGALPPWEQQPAASAATPPAAAAPA
jgi:uncharacterized protein